MKIMKETTEFQVPSDLSGSERRRLLSSRLVSDICRDARARRARLILLLAEGHTWDEVSERIEWGKSPLRSLQSWRRAFWVTRRVPGDGATHWSTRKLAAHLDVSHNMMVARVRRKHGLKPHPIERYMASNDPDFEKKAADMPTHRVISVQNQLL